MRLAYDPETDSLYIHLSERTSVTPTKSLMAWCWISTPRAYSWESISNTPASVPT